MVAPEAGEAPKPPVLTWLSGAGPNSGSASPVADSWLSSYPRRDSCEEISCEDCEGRRDRFFDDVVAGTAPSSLPLGGRGGGELEDEAIAMLNRGAEERQKTSLAEPAALTFPTKIPVWSNCWRCHHRIHTL